MGPVTENGFHFYVWLGHHKAASFRHNGLTGVQLYGDVLHFLSEYFVVDFVCVHDC